MGIYNDFDDAVEPTVVEQLKGKSIVDVQCGEEFSIALSDMGDVYTWGRGKEGQLGHGHRENLTEPTRVDGLKHEIVVQIAAGSQHCLVLTKSGKVFTWGSLHEMSEKKEIQTFGIGVELPGLYARKVVEMSSMAYFGKRISCD